MCLARHTAAGRAPPPCLQARRCAWGSAGQPPNLYTHTRGPQPRAQRSACPQRFSGPAQRMSAALQQHVRSTVHARSAECARSASAACAQHSACAHCRARPQSFSGPAQRMCACALRFSDLRSAVHARRASAACTERARSPSDECGRSLCATWPAPSLRSETHKVSKRNKHTSRVLLLRCTDVTRLPSPSLR